MLLQLQKLHKAQVSCQVKTKPFNEEKKTCKQVFDILFLSFFKSFYIIFLILCFQIGPYFLSYLKYTIAYSNLS